MADAAVGFSSVGHRLGPLPTLESTRGGGNKPLRRSMSKPVKSKVHTSIRPMPWSIRNRLRLNMPVTIEAPMGEKRSKAVHATSPPIPWATCSPSTSMPPMWPTPAKEGKSATESPNSRRRSKPSAATKDPAVLPLNSSKTGSGCASISPLNHSTDSR